MARIIDPIRDSEWDRIFASLPDRAFFLKSCWARVLNESYGYKPLYFVDDRKTSRSGAMRWDELHSGGELGAKQESGAAPPCIIPVMEVDSFLTGKRGVSLPFTDYCEPVAPDANSFRTLLDEVLRHGKESGWKYLELRGGESLLGGECRFSFSGEDGMEAAVLTAHSRKAGAVPHKTYLRHILQIQRTEEEQFRLLKPSIRRNIRTAQRSGVRVAISDLASDLREYYKLHCLTRKRHGVPPQPWSFFKSMHRNVISAGKGFIVLGRYQGQAIAGAVYFHSGKQGIYKFGASDKQYQHLRANNLVMWKAIRWFLENEFKELSLGRTDPENAGLLSFKKGWGTSEECLPYSRYYMGIKATHVRRKALSELSFSLLPSPVLRLLGRFLYKHVG